jgi:superfamily II DNA/RNA helicase
MSSKGSLMSFETQPQPGFESFNLIKPVLAALKDVGMKRPPRFRRTLSRWFSKAGIAGTGADRHGKTAALHCRCCRGLISKHEPQVLVLAPTRELAIQVAEAFQSYASHMKGLPCSSRIWRPELRYSAPAAQARGACGGWNSGAHHGPYSPHNAITESHLLPGAG